MQNKPKGGALFFSLFLGSEKICPTRGNKTMPDPAKKTVRDKILF